MTKDVDYVTAGRLSGSALGTKATAEGQDTRAQGTAAHAEGTGSLAYGNYSHAEGESTSANSKGAHAEGGSSTALGNYAHVEGYSTTTAANYSHAEGYETTASGVASHAEGHGTIANHLSQHVFGSYNVEDPSTASIGVIGNYIEIVGNGSTDSSRSNARTLDWLGNETLAGKLTVGTTPTNNMDVATKKYVDGAIPVASNITPSPNNATPAVGTATTWARADHVHTMPSASDVGAAPTNHRSSDTTYGIGTGTYYGHVKLVTSYTSTATVGEGIAVTPLAVKQVYDAIPTASSATPSALTKTPSAGSGTSFSREDHVHPTWYDSFISTALNHSSTVQLNTNGTAHGIFLIVNIAKTNGASNGFAGSYLLSGYGSPTATSGTDFAQKRSAKTLTATPTYVTVTGNQAGWEITNTGSSVDALITAIVLNGSVTFSTS